MAGMSKTLVPEVIDGAPVESRELEGRNCSIRRLLGGERVGGTVQVRVTEKDEDQELVYWSHRVDSPFRGCSKV